MKIWGPKNFLPKRNFGYKQILGPKKFRVWKNVWQRKLLSQKKLWVQKNFVSKIFFWSNKCRSKKIVCTIEIWFHKKFRARKNFEYKKFWRKKIWSKNCSVQKKLLQKICWLPNIFLAPQKLGRKKIFGPKKFWYQKFLKKCGSLVS